MCNLNYRIRYLPGEANVVPDLLSRWTNEVYRKNEKARATEHGLLPKAKKLKKARDNYATRQASRGDIMAPRIYALKEYEASTVLGDIRSQFEADKEKAIIYLHMLLGHAKNASLTYISGNKEVINKKVTYSMEAQFGNLVETMDRNRKISLKKQSCLRKFDNTMDLQYAIGDYVYMALTKDKQRQKVLLHWTGPYQIVGITRYGRYSVKAVFDTRQRTFEVHQSRIKLFCYPHQWAKSHEEELQESFLYNIKQQFEVEDVMEIKKSGHHFEAKVRWAGFDQKWDTWEAVEAIGPECYKILKRKARLVEAKHKQEFLEVISAWGE